jgi:hypothetical protein
MAGETAAKENRIAGKIETIRAESVSEIGGHRIVGPWNLAPGHSVRARTRNIAWIQMKKSHYKLLNPTLQNRPK